MNIQPTYNKNNEPKNNSEPSANRALPPFTSLRSVTFGSEGSGGGSSYILIFPTNFLCFPSPMMGA